jgi:phage repressor protein C with HTH and peptisase S24 domain
MGFIDKAEDLLNKHDDKVDQGLDRAGEQARTRFAGHDDQIDRGVDQAQQRTGAGDTTQQAETARAQAPHERQARGNESAPEVPGGPDPEVPAGPGDTPPQR